MTEARKGKIARLPQAIRVQVNQRIRDGLTGSQICAWLNGLDAVKPILAEHFEGNPITEQNLSEWRAGGYQDWLAAEGRVERVRQLSDFAFSLAQASGGNLGAGAAAIAGGKILELLESADDENIIALSKAASGLRDSDTRAAQLQTLRERLAQKDRELALAEEKFRRETCQKFLEWYKDARAREIAESPATNAKKIADLRDLYYKDVADLEAAGGVELPE